MRGNVRFMVLAMMGVLAFATSASAAEGGLELTPQFGWQWGGTQEYWGTPSFPDGGSIHANANVTYGGTLGAELRPGYHGELSFHYQSTDLINRPDRNPSAKLATLTTQYYLLQGRRVISISEGATPFVLGGVGTVIYNGGGESKWYLAFTAGAGATVAFSESVGLRLQARALIPVQWFGTGLYFGAGGSGFGASSGTTLIQGDASLGLTFNLGS